MRSSTVLGWMTFDVVKASLFVQLLTLSFFYVFYLAVQKHGGLSIIVTMCLKSYIW